MEIAMNIRQLLSRSLFLLILAALPVCAQDAVRRLTHEEAVKAAVSKPQPPYPPVARQLRIQGHVEVEVSITPSGAVDTVKVLSGNPALTGTVGQTLKTWRFEPIVVDGKPAHAVAVLGFTFKL
jgi:TonB family protein